MAQRFIEEGNYTAVAFLEPLIDFGKEIIAVEYLPLIPPRVDTHGAQFFGHLASAGSTNRPIAE